MSPLRPPRQGRTGRRAITALLVTMLLASVVPPGVVAGVDVSVGSDSAGHEMATAGRVLGADGAVSLFGQFDPDDDEDGEDDENDEEADDGEDGDDEDGDDEDRDDEEDDGDVDDGGGEEGDDGDGDADESDADAHDGDRDDETGVGDLIEPVLTEVVGGPGDGDRPGGDAKRTPRPDGSERGGAGDGDGDRSADESDSVVGPAGGGAPAPASQVDTPTSTATPGTPAPARIRVDDVSTNRSVVAEGEPVSITATLVNTGETGAEHRVRLRLFGEVVDARTVTVPANGNRVVSFVRTIVAPGTYEATVGNASATVTVEPLRSTTATDAGPASQETPGFTVPATLLGVVVAALLVRLRRG